MNIFAQIASVVVPLLLWVMANWCLTTLFDGEGSFKDIFIATSYSFTDSDACTPLVILSNMLAQNEGTVNYASCEHGVLLDGFTNLLRNDGYTIIHC